MQSVTNPECFPPIQTQRDAGVLSWGEGGVGGGDGRGSEGGRGGDGRVGEGRGGLGIFSLDVPILAMPGDTYKINTR